MRDASPRSELEPVLRIELAARPEHLPQIRRGLEGLGLSEALLDDAQLLTTELISNSIRHAGLDPDDVIAVTVTFPRNTVRIAVQDGGTRTLPEHVVAGSIRPSPTGRSGWGLYLVDRIATRWGTNIGGVPGFWFELEEPAPKGRID